MAKSEVEFQRFIRLHRRTGLNHEKLNSVEVNTLGRKMKSLVATFLVSIVLLAAGCERYAEIYTLRFLSKSGDTLATGTIKMKSPLPHEGKIRARYHLEFNHAPRADKAVDWFYRLFEGKEEGEMEWEVRPEHSEEFPLVLEFMPGLADANIAGMAPKLKDGKASGEWWYSVMAGGSSGGAFEIERK